MLKDYGKITSTKIDPTEKVNHEYEGYVKGFPFRDVPIIEGISKINESLMKLSEISKIESIIEFEDK